MVVDDRTGSVLEAWHDQQVSVKLARGYSGAIAQMVNAPYTGAYVRIAKVSWSGDFSIAVRP